MHGTLLTTLHNDAEVQRRSGGELDLCTTVQLIHTAPHAEISN